MNLLVVSPFVPLPATEGGRIRVWNLIKNLTDHFQITLLAPHTFNSEPDHFQEIREHGIQLVVSDFKPRLTVRSIDRLMRGYPIPLVKYYDDRFRLDLMNLLDEVKFDAVQFEMLHAGQYLGCLARSRRNRKTPAFLVQHNIDSLIWFRLARNAGSPIRRSGALLQSVEFERVERKLCPRFRACLCMSDEDAARLRRIAPKTVTEVVPNGVDLDFFRPIDREPKWNQAIYLGSMDWSPNEDAVLYFVNRIWGRIRNQIPDATFLIVGQYPSDRVRSLDGRDGIHVTGRVDDVRSYLASSSVLVLPLRIGGGTRLKTLEALAMGKAVVSTSIGCEGQGLIHGRDLIIADDPDDFADHTVRLMKNPSERIALGTQGRKTVESRFSWKSIAKKNYRIISSDSPE